LEPPAAFAAWEAAERLQERSGVPDIGMSGWWFPSAGWLRPRPVIDRWLSAETVTLRAGRRVQAVVGEPGDWRIVDEAGGVHGGFRQVVVAAGERSGALLPGLQRWIEPCRGQVSWTGDRQAVPSLRAGVAVMREGYALDLPETGLLFGASFLPGDTDRTLRTDEHRGNRDRLATIAPSLGAAVSTAGLRGRASARATTPDRLPLVGEVAPGVWVHGGHGARGLAWSAWLAESILASITDTPSPLPASLAATLRPQRFDERAARRR
jgi:tRNA 5-methylaminomethyl-2-thiouridine biosynthesis bifunctional protein